MTTFAIPKTQGHTLQSSGLLEVPDVSQNLDNVADYVMVNVMLQDLKSLRWQSKRISHGWL
jgi:hypothetical protein